MSIVYLNGDYIEAEQAKVSIFDRGFMFADSLYEMIPVYSGRAFCLEQHLQRLRAGLQAIQLAQATASIDWPGIIAQVISRNGGGDQTLYLQISRGVSRQRLHQLPENVVPTLVVLSSPLTNTLRDVAELRGIRAIHCEDIRWQRFDLKTTALIANVLLRQQAVDRQCQEAILIREGQAIEGAASNLFVVLNGTIHTAPKDSQILAGVTRDLLLGLIRQRGLDYQESTVSEAELTGAEEIWMTSSTKEIMPVIELDGKAVGDGGIGPQCQAVTALYLDYKQQWIAAGKSAL